MARTHGPLRVVDNCDRGFCMLGSYLMLGIQLSTQKEYLPVNNDETKNSRVSQISLFS